MLTTCIQNVIYLELEIYFVLYKKGFWAKWRTELW